MVFVSTQPRLYNNRDDPKKQMISSRNHILLFYYLGGTVALCSYERAKMTLLFASNPMTTTF